MLPLEPCRLPIEIQKDIEAFLEKVEISDEELKNLKISGVKGIDISMAKEKLDRNLPGGGSLNVSNVRRKK